MKVCVSVNPLVLTLQTPKATNSQQFHSAKDCLMNILETLSDQYTQLVLQQQLLLL